MIVYDHIFWTGSIFFVMDKNRLYVTLAAHTTDSDERVCDAVMKQKVFSKSLA